MKTFTGMNGRDACLFLSYTLRQQHKRCLQIETGVPSNTYTVVLIGFCCSILLALLCASSLETQWETRAPLMYTSLTWIIAAAATNRAVRYLPAD